MSHRILVALMFVAGCGSRGGSTTPTAPAPGGRPLPAMLGYVPADSPYVVASLDPLEKREVAKVVDVLGGVFVQSLETSATSDDSTRAMLAAVRAELGGPWTVDRHEALGFSASPRFVLFGIGLYPVLRIELADAAKALATIERMAKRMGTALPPMETRGSVRFWRIGTKGTMVISITGGDLVFAAGPRDKLDGILDVALGVTKPSASMADGGRLLAAIKRHNLGAHLIGELDLRRVIDELVTTSGAQLTSACRSKVDALATQLPRVTVGHKKHATNAITGAMFFELGGDLLSNARELPVQAPSIATVLRGSSIMAMAGGVDVPALRRLTKDLAERTHQLGEVCAQDDLRELGDQLDGKLALLAAGPIASLTGFAMALHSYEPSPDGGKLPKKVDAVGVVTSTDAQALYAQLAGMVPQINMLGIVPDGALHEILAGMGVVPFPLFAGIGAQTLLLAAGDDERDRAESALNDNVQRPVPFLVVDYDYAKFEQLQRGLGIESKTTDRATTDQLLKYFGRGNFTVSLEDDSLAAWTSIELK